MGKFFSIKELTKTNTNLPNKPDSTITKNLNELIELLDDIREKWTLFSLENRWWSPCIIVNSGYRSEEVNKAVGGSSTSAHLLGYAADIIPDNGKNLEFFNFVKDYLLSNNIAFDQLINEKPINGIPSWIHIGLRNNKGEQRKQIFTIK